MELDRCDNLLRLSLEGSRGWEKPSLRSLRPPRLPQRVLANFECLQPSILAESFHQVEQLHLKPNRVQAERGERWTLPARQAL